MGMPLVGAFLTSIITYVLPTLLTSILLFYGYVFLANKKQKPERARSPFPESFRRPEQFTDENDDDEDPLGKGEDALSPFEENLDFVPYKLTRGAFDDMKKASREFYEVMNKRRTVRFFSRDPVPIEIIENVLKTAG